MIFLKFQLVKICLPYSLCLLNLRPKINHRPINKCVRNFRYCIIKFKKFYSTETKSTVRVRFAPSPTGYIHLGGLRTALYNYLFAKSQNGSFVLRIEDTDNSRTISDSVESIEKDLAWACIFPDESPSKNGAYGPYMQSQRNSFYEMYIKELLEKGLAYKCFCTSDRIQKLRQLSRGLSYDNKCRTLTISEIENLQNCGKLFCVRFKVKSGDIDAFSDLIFGEKKISLSDFEGDFVLMKSDGTPTYHFASVIDDHLMKITHVLRGNEWLTSVPKHLLLYKAFNWVPPVFGHLPQLLNEDGTKLSKRQKDLHIRELRQQGFSSDSLLNFITSIGGGFLKEGEFSIKSMRQLIATFHIDRLRTNSYQLEQERLLTISRLDFQKKLCNSQETETLLTLLRKEILLSQPSLSLDSELSDAYLKSVLYWSRERVNKWKDLAEEKYNYLWSKPDLGCVKKGIFELNLDSKYLLCEVLNSISELKLNEFESEKIKLTLSRVKKENKLKNVNFMKLLRNAICGVTEGPPIVETMLLLGQDRSIQRLKNALQLFS